MPARDRNYLVEEYPDCFEDILAPEGRQADEYLLDVAQFIATSEA